MTETWCIYQGVRRWVWGKWRAALFQSMTSWKITLKTQSVSACRGWWCRHAIGFRHCPDKGPFSEPKLSLFQKAASVLLLPQFMMIFFPLQKILDWGIVLMICSVFQRGWLIWKTQQDSWNHCQKLSSVLLSQLPAFCAFAAETGPLKDAAWHLTQQHRIQQQQGQGRGDDSGVSSPPILSLLSHGVYLPR